jgi:hypothetical protein
MFSLQVRQPDRQAAEDVDRRRLSSRVLEDAVA